MNIFIKSFIYITILIIFASCKSELINKQNKLNEDFTILDEHELLILPFQGELSERYSEISGLCWYGSKLLVLPQYPSRFNPDTSKIFFIEKSEINNFIDGKSQGPINYGFFSIDISGIEKFFSLGSGFESLTVNNNYIFLTIEYMEKGSTRSILIKGEIDSLENRIILDKSSITEINHKLSLYNISDESILYFDDKIIPIFEVYGYNINSHPKVPVFSTGFDLISEWKFPTVEYRITDATSVDDSGRFWAINYFYPGDNDKLNPAKDNLFEKYGIGESHKNYDPVERIVEFQIVNNKIIISQNPPLYIKLLENESRNWEGIAKFGNKGFLLATDTFPQTIIAFLKVNIQI